MEKKAFQAESQRLLDLMINSIYTHKEIFLRELLSNASDAVDKLAYKALTDDQVGLNRSEFKITLTPDQIARTLTVSDNGVGMTKEELEENLGTIAKSGSLQFKQDMAAKDEGKGQERCGYHRPVRRGFLLRLHGGRSGHRHLPGLWQRRGLALDL